MSHGLVSTPSWHDRSSPGPVAAPPPRRLVVLCDVDETYGPVVSRHLGGASVAHVDSRDDGPAQSFERAATRLLGELQRLLAQPRGGRCVVQVACRQGQPSGYAGLLGMLRSAVQEDPALHGQLIEFSDWPSAEDLGQLLRADGGTTEEHLRYVNGVRQVRTWERATPVAAPPTPMWKPGGVYLVSGGAGGVGRLIVTDIARHAPDARVVVCGRSALTDGERQALGACGYQRVDVTDAAAVRGTIDDIVRQQGRLDGIVHAAGLLRDNYVLRATHRELHEVLAPKIAGLVNLDEASRHLPLDFLLAFSSCAGSMGNAGQAGYAAANGFMDAYQAYRHHLVASGQRRGRSLSIGWTLWREGGMSVPADDRPALAERFGRPLDTPAALHAMHRAMELDAAHVRVMDTDVDAETDADRANVRVPAVAGAAPAGLRARVLPKLKDLLAETLRIDAARLDADAPLDSFGIDSLAVTRINRRFEQWFGTLPKTLLYQHPTLTALADHLAERHADGCRRWLDVEPVAVDVPVVERISVPVAAQPPADEPIAIIGLSGRYPDAPDVAAFWQNLRAGRDSVGEIPAERWSLEGFYEPDPQRAVRDGASYSKWGAFLSDFARFDAAVLRYRPA